LHVTLKRPTATRAETSSTQAYDHYLQGRHLFNRRSESDVLQAKSHFEKAVELDPEYGRAWAALAGVYLVSQYENVDLPDAKRNWRRAAERATATSPDLAEAHYRAAQYFWHSGDSKSAREHLDRAIALDPEDPLLLGMSLTKGLDEGRIDEVIATQRKLVAADPLSATHRGNLGQFLALAGRYEEAQREFERSLELSPAMVDMMGDIADALVLQRRPDEAIAVASRIPAGHVRDQRLALAHFARGDVVTGEQLLANLRELTAKQGFGFEVAVAIAEVFAARHDADGAFHWLEIARRRAQEQHGAVAQWVFYDEFLVSPFLKPLRSDPRWQALRPPDGYGK
jgi:tetratricopeptide (TPR) repeat protein